GFVANIFRKSGITSVEVFYLGVELLKYSRMRNENNLLYVGSFKKQKGVIYLLEAIPLIASKIPDIHLFVAGDGVERECLEAAVTRLKIGKYVTFLGWVPNKCLQEYYDKSNILVVPSIGPESFGLIGLEAMSVGRPVVASNVGGIPEWLDNGITGYLVEPGKPEQIAEKVIKLISDRESLKRMGLNARRKAETFDINRHVIELEKIYRRVVA
ncbi:hypothetical protein COT48_00160, partial [Candidatus Woesearchaeota archaeon CG08_land_8_20_14_0_20_47_9]